VTDKASDAILLQPFIEVLQPYIIAVLSTLVSALVGLAVAKFTQWTNIQINASQVAALKSAAATEAGAMVAAASDNLKGRSISVGSPMIASAADRIAAKLPDTVAAVGLTPGALETIVAGEIGKLQSAQGPAELMPVAVAK
jgi:hypothetical protein